MAYNSSTGIVSEPVDIEDIRSATGQSSYNIGEIITNAVAAGAINKWSKVKPLKWDSEGIVEITGDNYRGSNTDKQNGIFYGLKAGASNIANIHSSNWDYVGYPTQDFRYTDFNGYNKNAVPTISGRSSKAETGSIIGSAQIPLDLYITWTTSDYSVDILQCVPNVNNDLSNAYVVVVIGTYVRAMINSNTGTVTPIVYNGTRQTTFQSYPLPESFQTGNSYSVSFAILDQSNISVDIVNNWVNLNNISLGGVPAIGIPNAVGYTCTISIVEAYHGTWRISSVTGSASVNSGRINFTVNYFCSSGPLRDANYEWQLTIRGKGRGTYTGTFSRSAGQTGSLSPFIVADELLTDSNPFTVTYDAYLYGIGTAGTRLYTLASESGTLTITPREL